MHPHASVHKPPTKRRATTRSTLVFLDLRASGSCTFHTGSTPEHITIHALPRLELAVPAAANTAAWQYKGELVLTCSNHPLAMRLEMKGTGVEGKVLDADTLRTVATVRGGLEHGVVLEAVGSTQQSAMQVLPEVGSVLSTLSLDALGGLRMPLLWSTLHDALLFAVPDGLSLRPLHVQADNGEGRGSDALPPCIKVCIGEFRFVTHVFVLLIVLL